MAKHDPGLIAVTDSSLRLQILWYTHTPVSATEYTVKPSFPGSMGPGGGRNLRNAHN